MRILYLGLIFFCLLWTTGVQAQCAGGRYVNKIFPSVNISTVTYSAPYNLQMDIYQPAGDTMSARPVIILAHGGSFVGGDRMDDSAVVWLCRNFAMRGYVTASIDYRLTGFASLGDSVTVTDEVVKAISDGKAAIRYFVKDRATANTLKIDTNRIYIGGNSAGAVLYMHVGYLDSLGECAPGIATAIAANGGFEGNSGNSGYATRFAAIINLAGALNKASFASPGNKPSVNIQGDMDNVVPYDCGNPIGGIVPVQLCGLGALEPVYNANIIYHMSYVFHGDLHVPWDYSVSDTSYKHKFKTVDSLVTVFLYQLTCTNMVEVAQVPADADLNIYPNPASELVNITAASAIKDITIYDGIGKVVISTAGDRQQYEINTAYLAPGVYFARVRFADAGIAPQVRKIMVNGH